MDAGVPIAKPVAGISIGLVKEGDKTALLTDRARNEVGFDCSIGFQYRPLLTDNVIVSAGFGALIPGRGFRDIYQTNPSPVPGYDSPGNRGRVPESGGDCGASAQWLGAVQTKTGQRSDHRLRCGKTGHPGDSRCPRPQLQPQPRKPF